MPTLSLIAASHILLAALQALQHDWYTSHPGITHSSQDHLHSSNQQDIDRVNKAWYHPFKSRPPT